MLYAIIAAIRHGFSMRPFPWRITMSVQLRSLRTQCSRLLVVLIVAGFVGTGCHDPGSPVCPAVLLFGVMAQVEGLEHGTYTIDFQKGTEPWESCEGYGGPGGCALDIVGLIAVRVTADDGRVQTKDVMIKGNACGPLYPPGTVVFTFDSLNG